MSLVNQLHLDVRELNSIVKSYNALDYRQKFVSLLEKIFPINLLENLNKYELHKLLNETVVHNYHGEEFHKYKLANLFLGKERTTCAFEIKVNNSRLDFLVLNRYSKSFEIKSELDNLSKLEKQMDDYILAFDYNYVVIDERHLNRANDILNESYGIWCYNGAGYKQVKSAVLNKGIDAEFQLRQLTKKELLNIFPSELGNIPLILKNVDEQKIQKMFKSALKMRYDERWRFLQEYQYSILPLDLQFFFNTKIKPEFIYF